MPETLKTQPDNESRTTCKTLRRFAMNDSLDRLEKFDGPPVESGQIGGVEVEAGGHRQPALRKTDRLGGAERGFQQEMAERVQGVASMECSMRYDFRIDCRI